MHCRRLGNFVATFLIFSSMKRIISTMSLMRQIFKINVLKKLLNEKNSCVSLVQCTRLLALPPSFLNDMTSGILYLLNGMLKKYDRTLDGILMGYQNVKVLSTGIIPVGAAETEVNIRVEFYIFKPKIGNYLEGVVNKKSNNHIGCLVHHYFNASILKPEDIFYEDWMCKDYNVDDKIIFKVKDLDFTGMLPRIEGIVDEITIDKTKYKTVKNSSHVDKNMAKTHINELENSEKNCTLVRESIVNKDINVIKQSYELKGFKKTTKSSKNKNNGKIMETDSIAVKDQLPDMKNKRKKEAEKNEITTVKEDSNSSGKAKEKYVGENDTWLDNMELETNYSSDTTKKKNKSKRKRSECDKPENENLSRELISIKKFKLDNIKTDTNLVEQKFEGKNFESNFSVVKSSGINGKRKNKKKRKNKEESFKTKDSILENECLSEKDDSLFCSTQLEQFSVLNKMRVSLCSPIHADFSLVSPKEENKSRTNDCEPFKLLDEVEVDNNADKERIPRKKEKHRKSRKKRKKDRGEESEECFKTETHKNGSMYDLVSSPSPKKDAEDKSLFSGSEKSFKGRESMGREINGKASACTDAKNYKPKTTVKRLLNQFYQEEIDKMKSSSNDEHAKCSREFGSETKTKVNKSQKKVKKKVTKKEEPGSVNDVRDSLYEKLLNQAKSAINFSSDESSTKSKASSIKKEKSIRKDVKKRRKSGEKSSTIVDTAKVSDQKRESLSERDLLLNYLLEDQKKNLKIM